MRPEYLIDIIKQLVELDMPATSAIFKRDFDQRFKAIAQDLQLLENSLGENPICSRTKEELDGLSFKVAKTYRKLIQEFYETAALLEVMGRIHGDGGAVRFWRHYLFLAQGHPDQQERLQIAEKHLRQLEQRIGEEEENVLELEQLRAKQKKHRFK